MVFHHDDFHGEDHPSDGHVKGGGDGCSRARGNQNTNTVIGKVQYGAQLTATGCTQMYTGAFSSYGKTTYQGNTGTEELAQGVLPGETTLVRGEPLNDMNHTGISLL